MIVTVQEQVLTPADDLSRVLVWSMVIGLNWSENIGSPWRYQPKNGGFINRATPKIINFFRAFHCWNMLKPYGFWDVLGIIPRNLHINGVSCLAPAQKYQKPPAVQRPDSEQMEWNGLNRALQVKLNHFNTWSGMIHPQYLSFGDIEFTTAGIIIHVDRENEVWTSGWNGALQYVQTFCAHVLGAINATSKRQKMWVFRWQQWSQKDVNVFADLTSLSSLKPYHSFANYFLDCIHHIHNCSGTISYITCHLHDLFWKHMFSGTEESSPIMKLFFQPG